MAFSPSEARRGALVTVITFAILVAIVAGVPAIIGGASYVVAALISVSAFLIAGAVASVAALFLYPLIVKIGWSLRAIRSWWVHVCAYLLIGGATGALISSALYAVPFGLAGVTVEMSHLLRTAGMYAVLAAIATVVGWGLTLFLAWLADQV